MKTEVFSTAGFEGFAIVGLIIFLAAFALILVKTMLIDGKKLERHAGMPLDDGDELAPPGEPAADDIVKSGEGR